MVKNDDATVRATCPRLFCKCHYIIITARPWYMQMGAEYRNRRVSTRDARRARCTAGPLDGFLLWSALNIQDSHINIILIVFNFIAVQLERFRSLLSRLWFNVSKRSGFHIVIMSRVHGKDILSNVMQYRAHLRAYIMSYNNIILPYSILCFLVDSKRSGYETLWYNNMCIFTVKTDCYNIILYTKYLIHSLISGQPAKLPYRSCLKRRVECTH